MFECLNGIRIYLSRPTDVNHRLLFFSDQKLETRLLELLTEKDRSIRQPLLKIFSFLCGGPSNLIMRFFSRDFLNAICPSKGEDSPKASRYAFTSLSSLVLIVDQAFDFLCSLGQIDNFMSYLHEEESDDMVEDLLEFFTSVVYRNESREIDMLINHYHLIDSTLIALKRTTVPVLLQALKCLDVLLDHGKQLEQSGENPIAQKVLHSQFYPNINHVSYHISSLVQTLCANIISRYLNC